MREDTAVATSSVLQRQSNNSSTREQHAHSQQTPQWFTAAPLLSQFYAPPPSPSPAVTPYALTSTLQQQQQQASSPSMTLSSLQTATDNNIHEQLRSPRYDSQRHVATTTSHVHLHQQHNNSNNHSDHVQQHASLRRFSLHDRHSSESSSLLLLPPPAAAASSSLITTTTPPQQQLETDAIQKPPVQKPPPATTRRKKPALRLRNFLCMHPGCGKAFTDNAHLRDHTFVHTRERCLECTTCGKRFNRVSTLHDHARVHSREQPYVCHHVGCVKRYSSRSALRFHVASHRVASSADTPAATATTTRSTTSSSLAVDVQSVAPSRTTEVPITTTHTSDDSLTQQLHARIQSQQMQIAALQAELERVVRTAKKAKREQLSSAAVTKTTETPTTRPLASPMVAPVHLLVDGVKPFACGVCNDEFVNFYQLTFHAKQHAGSALADVVQHQTPVPVGPKYCPEIGCAFGEASGTPLKTLQTLKRHWQRCHQLTRPHACRLCAGSVHAKTFKTRENLRAHEKECRGVVER